MSKLKRGGNHLAGWLKSNKKKTRHPLAAKNGELKAPSTKRKAAGGGAATKIAKKRKSNKKKPLFNPIRFTLSSQQQAIVDMTLPWAHYPLQYARPIHVPAAAGSGKPPYNPRSPCFR